MSKAVNSNKADVDTADFYSSLKRLRTAKHDHYIGVEIAESFVSKLDGRRYVKIQTNTINPWDLATVRTVLAENWGEGVAQATSNVVRDLDQVIAELMEHRMRLAQEIAWLSQANDEEE